MGQTLEIQPRVLRALEPQHSIEAPIYAASEMMQYDRARGWNELNKIFSTGHGTDSTTEWRIQRCSPAPASPIQRIASHRNQIGSPFGLSLGDD
jgi:hypothetical protein